jgi:hypothetical protein
MATSAQREDTVRSTTTYRNRVARHLALAFAIAAVAAPIAQAQTPIPADLVNRQFWAVDRAGHDDPGTHDDPRTIPAELSGRQFGRSNLPLVTIPEDLSGREFGPATFTTDIPTTIPVADGVDWRDAGIGAAVAAASTLMVGALMLLASRRRHLAGT